MKGFKNNIIQPDSKTLLLFGILSFICLTAYIWYYSFAWLYFFSINHYIITLLIVLGIALFTTYILDKKFNWKLKKYLHISIIQLLFLWIISNPIRTWQIESSLEKSKIIVTQLNSFKQQYEVYPNTLIELKNQLNQDIPVKTNIGTQFQYKTKNKKKEYKLWFQSYYGYTAIYNNKSNQWIIAD